MHKCNIYIYYSVLIITFNTVSTMNIPFSLMLRIYIEINVLDKLSSIYVCIIEIVHNKTKVKKPE